METPLCPLPYGLRGITMTVSQICEQTIKPLVHG
jgi:hypothetical protein